MLNINKTKADALSGRVSRRFRRATGVFRENASGVQPIISLITPTWNTEPSWFADLAVSILEQSFIAWQWCIVDDSSSQKQFHSFFEELRDLPNITITQLEQNRGISSATNVGLRLARGEFVCFVDHDDMLARDALARCWDVLAEGYDAVYTDSDKFDEDGRHKEPFYKPDWSPEFFRGVMYVGHLLCVRRDIATAIGGFDSRFDGVQDFEFFLRYSEAAPRIAHIPEILYHWRTVTGSVASAPAAKGDLEPLQQEAVARQQARLGLAASAERGDFPHRVKITPFFRETHPRISIIIPTKDSPDILAKCLYSLFSKTTYPNFEVLCVDNDTTDARALNEMKDAPIDRILFPGKFNFSRANNVARRNANGEYLVFMNNDVEVITPEWLEQMLYYAEQEDVGAVGSLLLYSNGTVQHAGVVLGCRGIADHLLRGAPGNSDGYAGSLSCAREVSAVTAACLMVRCSLYDEVRGFNEHFFTAYQDVDLCLKLRERNKRIIFTPRARLIHHESISRGKYYDMVDHNLLLDLWGRVIEDGDPYYNSNFDVNACDFSLGAVAKSQLAEASSA